MRKANAVQKSWYITALQLDLWDDQQIDLSSRVIDCNHQTLK